MGQQTAPEPKTDQFRLRDFHGWGRFEKGSWRAVRVVKETFDETGKLSSVSTSDTRAALTAITDKAFTLTTETQLEIAGRRFKPSTRTDARPYYGIETDWERKDARELNLPGGKVRCEVLRVKKKGASVTELVLAKRAPFLFGRTVANGAAEASANLRVTVLAVDLPYKVLANIHPVAYVRTVQSTAESQTITIEVYSPQVPGGVVAQSTKIVDRKTGNLLERRTMELTDYGVASANARRTRPIRRSRKR
ncbi:MAG: hypothetical protein QGG36_28125 [Pirellulaceae bacterium]|nr:hypothetical protein [Pirellulaceae bacterium]MDP7019697.1 hypothetical protein [Pirellulaceae bacterium]